MPTDVLTKPTELEEQLDQVIPCEAVRLNCSNTAQWRAVTIYGFFTDGTTQQLLCHSCKTRHIDILFKHFGTKWSNNIRFISL